MVCMGAIVAQEVFGKEQTDIHIPTIIALGTEPFHHLLELGVEYASVASNGRVVTAAANYIEELGRNGTSTTYAIVEEPTSNDDFLDAMTPQEIELCETCQSDAESNSHSISQN
jgi:hypothetical protein